MDLENEARSDITSLNMMKIVGNLICILIGLCGLAVARQEKSAAKDLPYVSVDHPEFITAEHASFLADPDRLIGVMDGKTAKAYPAAILAQHGVVLDRLKAGPIAVTW
jgi:hypothetical protein